jgi:hypothetical protein
MPEKSNDPRTRVPEGSKLTTRPPKPLTVTVSTELRSVPKESSLSNCTESAVRANGQQSVKLHGILSKISVIFVNFTKFAMPNGLVVVHVGVVTVTGVTADRHTVLLCTPVGTR